MAPRKPKEPTGKSYTVCGTNAVFGHKPGETFTAVLSEFDETRLIQGGAIATTKREAT